MIATAADHSSPPGYIGWRRVDWDAVLAEIDSEQRFPAATTYVLLQRVEHIEFVTKTQAIAAGLFGQQWSSGHLFNATWELNWEKQGSVFLVRLLSEELLPQGWEQERFATKQETGLLLFGERKRDDDPGWREARIPRWLDYPVEKVPGRVRLVVVPYLREGMVVRMRLKGVTSK